MQFSVEQIRSVRNNYLDPPYPGFTLDEVCRRRRATQTKLVRGENAWKAKGTAQTTEEWVSRLVQGSLNKLSERNFDEIMRKLRTKELFSTNGILTNVVNLIFYKAIDEPVNSKLYAAVCFNLAKYEVALNDSDNSRPKSELRNAIVATAQREFKELRRSEDKDDKNLSEEALDQLRSNFMRRKRANIRFVGELCLNGVLSHTTIFSIFEVIMRAATEGGFPESENIEIISELLHTIGEYMDKQDKKRMDHYFELLAGLIKKSDNPYPHRIRFKIMDVLDLRKSAWGTKPKPQQTVKFSAGNAAGKGATPPPVASKKSSEGRVSESGSKSWRDVASSKLAVAPSSSAPIKMSTSTSGTKHQAAGAQGGKGAANAPSPAAAAIELPSADASAVTRSSKTPMVKFELRVRSLLQEWVSDYANDFVPQWINEFNNCDRTFASDGDLCVAVAVQVITEACITTRKEAQREACSFLIVGLYLMDEEMLRGFTGALASAIEDGILEDVPKFPERFMHMLRLTSSEKEINADVYYDAANVLCMAFNQLDDTYESNVDTLLDFWSKVPQPTAEEEAVNLGFPVIYSLCEPKEPKEGLDKLLGAIIFSLRQMGIVDADTSEELLNTEVPDNVFYNKVTQEYRRLVTKNESG
ncbi:unnamed protein product [Phytomonas sp. EM1]|nr:unnamed protein product [Phytomonas sp. EM1]|eukprot:CCW64629.1 unnamed protein product [Phytomonas sp. isolate EM1]